MAADAAERDPARMRTTEGGNHITTHGTDKAITSSHLWN